MTIHYSAFDELETNKHAACVPVVHHQNSRNPINPVNSAPKATKSKKVSLLKRLFRRRRSFKLKVSYSVSSERFG
jgi:hypothetical protein